MKDVVGIKTPTVLAKVKAFIRGLEQPHILRGELVISCKKEGGGHVPVQIGTEGAFYQVYNDPAVTVRCDDVDIVPLSEDEFQLLAAIKSREERYHTFIGHLDWGASLKIGDHVSVKLPCTVLSSTDRAVCEIRYVGELPSEPGFQFGVKIEVVLH